jgi:hypothetical protein
MYYTEKANGQLPTQMPGVKPTPEMLEIRAMGNKYHFAQWIVYSSTLWILKASLLVLYTRLTVGQSLLGCLTTFADHDNDRLDWRELLRVGSNLASSLLQ